LIPYEPRLTLRPLQERHCQQVIREPATLLGLPLGSGKTVITVEALLRNGSKRVLVVAPRNTFYGWERTVRRQYQDYTDDNLVRRIDSSASGKRAMTAFWGGEPGWYLVTWEFYRTRPAGFWDKLKADAVVLDEVQRMQNRNGKTWRNVRRVGKNSKRIAMSGTFTGNKMEGGWTTLRWLFPETETSSLYTTPLSFWNWVSDWLTTTENEWMGYTEVGGERYEEGTMLSYYQSYIHESDPTEVPEVNEIIIDVPMSAEQKRLYRELEKEYVVWLDTPDPITGKKPMVSKLPVTKRLRLRQITLGVPIINEENKVVYDVNCSSPKLDATVAELESLDPMEPVLVFVHSREFALVASARLTQQGYPSYAWVGGTSDKSRREAVSLWGKPNGIQVIVAVIEAIAEGTDGLQDVCSEEIWLSESENMMMNTQARSRIPRDGNKSKVVNRRRIIVPGTYDQKILDRHLQRRLELNKSLGAGVAA